MCAVTPGLRMWLNTDSARSPFMSASLLNQPLLVLANLPDQALAERLSNTLVEQGLAACVNILSPVQSVYRWQGKIQ
ncbi:divalent cation tolerance protein CutA, partial [Acinetobacter baumannii]